MFGTCTDKSFSWQRLQNKLYTFYVTCLMASQFVLVWEESGEPGENTSVLHSDHMTISHADAGYRNRVAAVRVERVTTEHVLHTK